MPAEPKPRFTPHPDYGSMSDDKLEVQQEYLQAEIDLEHDDDRRYWLEQRMVYLQSERKRRMGASASPPAAISLVLQNQALQGLAGEIVQTILPYTEASAVALLVNVLVSFGNLIGHTPHWKMERTVHPLNLFSVLVGATSRGRKGTSRSSIDYMLEQVDGDWRRRRVMHGLSSGQGLIWHVRDPIIEERAVKKDGEVTYEEVIVDKGVADKRLMIVEEEFSHVLKATPLEGNILSANLREAWDTGNLMSLTSGRKSPSVQATDAHVSIIGHITKPELQRHLDDTETANGFANRFLWFVVERSKSIPNPTGAPDSALDPLIERLAVAKNFAVKTSEIRRDANAEIMWAAVYGKLTDDVDGMVGAITSRGAPQVMRLASIYALLDRSSLIRPEHLQAALAVWDYSFASVRSIFGDAIGDPIADRIAAAVKNSEAGLSRTDITNLFSRHNLAAIDTAIEFLLRTGVIVEQVFQTAGRPKIIYIDRERGEQK